MAVNGGILTKKRRNIPRRERLKREIHRLLVEEGLSNKEICMRLNIPSRTLERWLHEIYHEDSLILLAPTIDEILTAANVYRDRLSKQRRDVLAMANDSNIDPESRLAAHNLGAELDKMIYLLSFETPSMIVHDLVNVNDRVKQLREAIERKGLNPRLVMYPNQLPKNLELKELPLQQQPQPSSSSLSSSSSS